MKVSELFEVVMKRPGSKYSDEQLDAISNARSERLNIADIKLVNALKSKCKNNLNIMMENDIALYRGFSINKDNSSSDLSWCEMPLREDPRKSLTDFNLFLGYFSTSPVWKEFPKRNFSNSCAISSKEADNFGPVWFIIPFDDASKFGVSDEDLNLITPKKSNVSINKLLQYLESTFSLLSHYHKRTTGFWPKSVGRIIEYPIFELNPSNHNFTLREINEIISIIDELLEMIDELEDYGSSQSTLLANHLNNLSNITDGTLEDWVDDNLTPDALNSKILSLSQLKNINQKSEIWFESGYIALKTEENIFKNKWFKEIIEQVNKS